MGQGHLRAPFQCHGLSKVLEVGASTWECLGGRDSASNTALRKRKAKMPVGPVLCVLDFSAATEGHAFCLKDGHSLVQRKCPQKREKRFQKSSARGLPSSPPRAPCPAAASLAGVLTPVLSSPWKVSRRSTFSAQGQVTPAQRGRPGPETLAAATDTEANPGGQAGGLAPEPDSANHPITSSRSRVSLPQETHPRAIGL